MGITHIYLIRHGESLGNHRNAFLGHTDLDLTLKGHKQAEKTAEYLKNIHADAIYSSDLLRAYNTAKHTADLKGMEVIRNEKLREIFAGDWENKEFLILMKEYNEEYSIWMNDIGLARCNNGESVAELQKRVVEEINKLAVENEGKTIFVFTHATPIRVFRAACEKKEATEIKDIPWASNASVTHAEYKDGKMQIIEYSKDSFLGDIRTALPKNV